VISKELETSLNIAVQIAHEAKHEFVTTEHLLLALLDNTSAIDVLRACNADIDQLRMALTEHLAHNVPLLSEASEATTQPSVGFVHVQGAGSDDVEGANVIVALFSEQDSHAAFFLDQQDVTRFDVVSYISHGIAKDTEELERFTIS